MGSEISEACDVLDLATGKQVHRYALVFVLAVWLVMTVVGAGFILKYASRIPIRDDTSKVEHLASGGGPTWDWLWLQEDVNRFPLAKLQMWATFRLAQGDLRISMLVAFLTLALAVLVLVLAVRSIRGRSSVCDAFVPLMFLHLAHAENFLWFHQPAAMWAAALSSLVIGFLFSEVWQRSSLAAAAAGLCLMLLPLQATAGMIPSVPLAVGFGAAGCGQCLSGEPGARRRGTILLIAAVATVFLIVHYFVGFDWAKNNNERKTSLLAGMFAAVQAMAISLGTVARRIWPLSAVFVPGLVAWRGGATILDTLRARSTHERLAGFARGMALAGPLLLALAVGWGRQSQGAMLDRYAMYLVPLLFAVYCSVAAMRRVPLRSSAEFVMFTVACAASLFHASHGLAVGKDRLADSSAFNADVRSGLPMRAIVSRHTPRFGIDEARFESVLLALRGAGIEPFSAIRSDPPIVVRTLTRAELQFEEMTEENGVLKGTGPGSRVRVRLDTPVDLEAVRMVYLLRNARNATTMEFVTVACSGDLLDSVQRDVVLVHFNPNRERHNEVQTFYLNRCVRDFAVSPSREPFEMELTAIELLMKKTESD